jgi:hypothetical protein
MQYILELQLIIYFCQKIFCLEANGPRFDS